MQRRSRVTTLWNFDVHNLIADAAQRHLEASPAWPRITAFLQDALGVKSLPEISTWADEIADGVAGPHVDPDTRCFLKTFGQTKPWHYVDLPAGVDRYDQRLYPRFTRRPNVVWACTLALRALERGSRVLSRANAFRWLVHLVADLHQPLHVGCGYVAYPGRSAFLVFDPREAARWGSDGGGSLLLLPNGIDLHTYWDQALGHTIATVLPEPHRLPELVVETAVRLPLPTAMPTLSDLPAEWTRDTLLAAREAYRHLRIVGVQSRHPRRYWLGWTNETEAEYIARNQPVLVRQLSLAAQRLAYCIATVFGQLPTR